jgi:hypothetical protein
VVTLTPSEVRENETGTRRGVPYKNEERVFPLDSRRRDAIVALLPSLRGKAGAYSLSDTVDDEGSHAEELTVEIEGVKWHFRLTQGPGHSKPPGALATLYALATGHELAK